MDFVGGVVVVVFVVVFFLITGTGINNTDKYPILAFFYPDKGDLLPG